MIDHRVSAGIHESIGLNSECGIFLGPMDKIHAKYTFLQYCVKADNIPKCQQAPLKVLMEMI